MVTRGVHGTIAGRQVALFTLSGPGGLEATISELGATIVSLLVPGRDGRHLRSPCRPLPRDPALPDSIHHEGEPGWPSIVLRPGETYRHSTVHRFAVE